MLWLIILVVVISAVIVPLLLTSDSKYTHKKCKHCRKSIKMEAATCRYCKKYVLDSNEEVD